MNCPQCAYDLRGSTGATCPECGVEVKVVVSRGLKVPMALMWVGGILIGLFCIAQMFKFWAEYTRLEILLHGYPDPAQLATGYRVQIVAHHASNIALGIGLLCIAIALIQTFTRFDPRLMHGMQNR